MSKLNLTVLALLFAAASAGFAVCMSFVHYATWLSIPPSAFQEFQHASALRTVPIALALGVPSLVLTTIVAVRGLPAVSRSLIWIAVILAAIPWIATPTVMIPIQGRLAISGPTHGLILELVWKDILLRSMPPCIQSMILFTAFLRSVQGLKTDSQ